MSFGHTPVELGPDYAELETGEHAVRWKGFLFVRGCVAGDESAARILTEFRRRGPRPALALAKGSFALCVFEKRSGSAWYTVDPFGLMRLFFSENVIGDDFFALSGQLGASRDAIDRQALAAFLRFGFYNRERTLDRRIRVLTGNDIAYRADGAAVRLAMKGPPAAEANAARFDFDAYIADLAIALQGQRISLDLTGGFDSRLVAACLTHAAAPIAEAVTSGQDGNRDVPIARKIAARLSIPHVLARHRIAGFEDRALKLLNLSQGQMGILTYDHMFQIQQERLARGMTLGIGGAGGELWKDFLWLQDFPRLKGAPDFQKLYGRRFEPRSPSSAFLTPSFSALFEVAGSDYLAEMVDRFGALQRTQAYDSAYADLRLPSLMGPSTTAGIHSGLPHFSPLLDREGVNASMHMLPQQRLFSRWHRQTISRVAPEVMKQRTTDGLSARTGISAVGDVPFYVADKTRRAVQKIAQRFNLPDFVHHALEDPQTLAYGQRMSLSGDAIERLKTLGIVSERVTPDQLSRAALDRALTAGLALLQIMA
jgi:hypothetical protein